MEYLTPQLPLNIYYKLLVNQVLKLSMHRRAFCIYSLKLFIL